MTLSESQIENQCHKWAVENGWLSYKFVSPSKRGVPDRVFLKNGISIFVEFKRPGGKLSKLQERQIEKIQDKGFAVFVIDRLPDFIFALNNYREFAHACAK